MHFMFWLLKLSNLTSIQPVTYVPSEDWADSQFGVHLKDIDLISVLAKRLIRVIRTG